MHIPPGYALFIPSAHPQGGRPARWSGSAASRIRCRPSGRSPRATATSSAWCAARSPTPTSPPRPAPVPPTTIRLCLSCNQECVGPHGPQPLARLHREPPHRPRARRASARRRPRIATAPACWSSAPDRPGLQAAIAAARNGHDVTVYEQERAGRRPGAAGGVGAEPGRARRPRAQPAGRVPAPRRARSSTASGCGRGWSTERRPDHVIVATGAEPARPWWVPPDQAERRATCATCSTARAAPVRRRRGHRRDRLPPRHLGRRAARRPRLRVEVVTNGMVVGQDLGITLDMEDWWMRASAKGIVQTTDLVPMGDGRPHAHAAAPPDRRQPGRARPTGSCSPCRPTRSSGSTTT